MKVLNAASNEGGIDDKAEMGRTKGSSEREFYYRAWDSRACYFALTFNASDWTQVIMCMVTVVLDVWLHPNIKVRFPI